MGKNSIEFLTSLFTYNLPEFQGGRIAPPDGFT